MSSLEQLPQQFAKAFKELSFAKKITLLLLIAGTIAGFAFIISWSGRPDFQLLYSGLSPNDAGTILAKLKEKKIPYQISSNGGTISVPNEHLYELRLEMASQGLPQGGAVGFELFDNTKLGMTEFAQNVNYQRAMQGELSRTISGFSEVENCRVHLVMPPKSLFVEDEEPATASVVLKLHPGNRLSKEQVEGIVHMVSSSIAGLSQDNVTVVDSSGVVLSGYKDRLGIRQISNDQLAYREKIENGMENRVRSMLERAFGAGKAIVRVACEIDFKRQEKTEELYYPENQVVRSEKRYQSQTKDGETAVGGIANIAAGALNEATNKNVNDETSSVFRKEDSTVNYEIGKVTSRIVEPVGKITKVSVAVIVDGTYKKVELEDGAQNVEYVPRSDDELAKLEGIVKSAVSFDKDRGDEIEVVNIPFETRKFDEGEMAAETGWFHKVKKSVGPAAKYGFPMFALFMGFLFIVRPMVRWLTTASEGGTELLQQLPKTVGELEREYAGIGALPFRDKASQMLASNNDMSVQMMRNWMQQK